MADTICPCGHPRRVHSRHGCCDCDCTIPYMDLSPRKTEKRK